MGWPSPSDKSKKWDKDEKAFEEKSYYTKIGERRERNWDPKYDIPEKDPHYTDKRDKRNRRATKIIVVIIMGVIASMLLFGEILENPLAENPSEESNIIVDEKLIQDLTREQSDITNIDASTDALHSYFNDRYLREDYRFMIKHYDWKVVYDNTEQVYRENTKNFGEMESVVFFANSNDSGKQGFVEIMRQVENSHTMIDTLPTKT